MSTRSAASLGLVADDATSILIRQVRDFLRDHAAMNALTYGEETSDGLLRLYVAMAIDDWNASPPLIGNITADRHPSPTLLIYKVLSLVLWSAAILQARNNLQYSDGGITVQTSDKAPAYMQLAGVFLQQYEMQKARLKKSLNIEQGYGGVHSEYLMTNYTAFWNSSVAAYEVLANGFHMG